MRWLALVDSQEMVGENLGNGRENVLKCDEIGWENGKRIDEGVEDANVELSRESGRNDTELVCFEVKEINH